MEDMNVPNILRIYSRRMKVFDNPNYTNLLLISYAQFLEIFSYSVNDEDFPKFNRWLIYTHMDFYNYVYNQVWAYKWYPLLFKFVYNTSKHFLFKLFKYDSSLLLLFCPLVI